MAENIFATLNIAGQGMTVQRRRLTAIANNIANANTTSGLDGEAYQREVVVSKAGGRTPFARELSDQITLRRTDNAHAPNTKLPLTAVERDAVVPTTMKDGRPPRIVYEPGHPEADAEGYVKYPDIDVVTEMVDMITAQRGFEANTQMVATAKNLARYSLEI